MDMDTKYRSLLVLALLNKVQEEMAYIINDNNDARFRNLSTQIFSVKQDLEDKLREDYEEEKKGGSLPQQNISPIVSPTTGVPITPSGNVPSNSGSVVNNNGGNVTNNGTLVGHKGNPVIPSTPQSNAPSVDAFFDDLLSGATGSNDDLKDALNKMAQQVNTATQSYNNSAPF